LLFFSDFWLKFIPTNVDQFSLFKIAYLIGKVEICMKKVYVAALGAIVSLFVPQVASLVHACGGTFCDSGPQTMPVEQTGENILYVMDGENVEAHIQIQYKGAAGRFAWVLPVQALPSFEIGSQPLFDAMLQGTVPTVQTRSVSACTVVGNSRNESGVAYSSSGPASDSGTVSKPTKPTVVKREQVGAFDITVLKGGSVQELVDWLDTNGYQQNPEASPILQEYLTKNYLFVAVKLVSGSETGDIHPLVVRYPGTEPCIPLKLTKIAATENMGVRAFFLGNDRVVAKNYKNVELNPARIDWKNRGDNYNDVVASAVDSPVANGHAFVTEFVGETTRIPRDSLYSYRWNANNFVNIQPDKVVSLLESQELVLCKSTSGCTFQHPLISSLLHEFVPVPEGMNEGTFYSCLSCYADKIDMSKWDGALFAQKFDERIVKPGMHAQELLQKWPKTTRLFTMISPSEMTEDPEFVVRKNLPDVSNLIEGTITNTCNVSWVDTSNDHKVYFQSAQDWPTFTNEMPYVERIVEYPESGEPIVLVDNHDKINKLLATHAASFPEPQTVINVGNKGGCQYPAGGSQGVPAHLLTIGALTFFLYRWRRRA
jgi:hypothetical protein